jgi:thiamine-phosphate pyrophosphorylase
MMRTWLCAVTNRRRFDLSTADLLRRIEWLAAAGIELVQIRERDLGDRDLASLVRGAVTSVRGSPARVVVNDRFDIAVAAGAAGVHLREDSAPAARFRRAAPRGFLIGCSVHDAARAKTLPECDYLVFGTVFPSRGKAAGHPVAGLGALREVCDAAHLPVLGIGGIDPRNARDVIGAGAAGVAAMESLMTVSSAASARDVVASFRSAMHAGAES